MRQLRGPLSRRPAVEVFLLGRSDRPRLRPDLVASEVALEQARALARAVREEHKVHEVHETGAALFKGVAITTSSPEESRGGSYRASFQNAGARSRRFPPWRRPGFLAGWPGRAGTRLSSCERHHCILSYLSPRSSRVVYLPLDIEGHCPLDAGAHPVS